MTSTQKMQLIYIQEQVLLGLNTDGGHHKQYYLERAYKAILGIFGDNDGKEFENAKNHYQWESPIPD